MLVANKRNTKYEPFKVITYKNRRNNSFHDLDFDLSRPWKVIYYGTYSPYINSIG